MENDCYEISLHGNLVNVYTNTISRSYIGINNGMINYVGTEPISSMNNIELGSKYILPGFINAHVHIESSLMLPNEYARVAITRGTTTIVADAHEIVNVKGFEGMKFMLADSKRTPLKSYFMIPSCVPATHLETSGAKIGVEEIKTLRDIEGILGLGEFMNFPGVVARKKEDIEKIKACKGMPIDGHAPGLTGKNLCKYISAGIFSDHECTTREEAFEKLSLGMWIMIREGTTEKNLSELIKIMTKENSRHFMLVTDDKDARDLLLEGDINHNLTRAVSEGLDPIEAIKMVTLNPAEHYCLKHLGGVSPGKCADIVVVDDLKKFNAKLVIIDGKIVAEDGEYKLGIREPMMNESILHTMNFTDIAPEDIIITINERKGKEKINHNKINVRVIGAIEHQIYTEALHYELNLENNELVPDINNDILKICVIERHKNSGRIGKGFVKGIGLKKGAIASSVAHDSHNVIVVGTNDNDICTAVNRLRELQGGFVAVCDKKIIGELPLPVAGLMSELPAEQIVEKMEELHLAVQDLGSKLKAPYMTISFLALPVIPELKITDYGLVDVNKFDFVPLFID